MLDPEFFNEFKRLMQPLLDDQRQQREVSDVCHLINKFGTPERAMEIHAEIKAAVKAAAGARLPDEAERA